MKKDIIRVAPYVRVSTDKPEQQESLEYQQKLFNQMLKEKGWEIYDFYIDSKTGTIEKRKDLMRLIQDAKDGKFDLIVAKELSRIARNQKLALELKELLENKRIDLITLDGAINTTTGDTNMFGLYAWVYEQEAQTTARRVKETLKIRAKEGKHHAQAPYGYKKVDGKLIVSDDETPENVKRIFREYIAGKGFDAIARGLYEDGYRTPSQVTGKKNASELWHGSTIRGILENPHYLGKMAQCREETISVVNKRRKQKDVEDYIVVENTHEPLVSEEDFNTVQSLLVSRRKNAYHTKDGKICTTRPHEATHLFTDIIYCADCGSGFHYKKNRKGYVCGRYDKHGKKACTDHIIREKELVDIIREDIKTLSRNVGSKNRYETIKNKLSKNKIKIEKELKNVEGKIEAITTFKTKALEKLIAEEITKPDYDMITNSKNQELEKLLVLQDTLKKRVNDEIDDVLFQKIKQAVDAKLELNEITREILNRFVDKIVVAEDSTVTIYYKFNGSDKIINELMK